MCHLLFPPMHSMTTEASSMASSLTPLYSHPFSSFFFIILIIFSSSLAQALVPRSKTFKFINEGDFGDEITENGASYRILRIFSDPFTLCFYNTTPNAYTLGLRMGNPSSESILRWAWDANRGNPVREKATLTFGRDGNLVLADSDGRVAWQTGTANKGVVDLKLLSNGNLVLLDARGRVVWQSFDYPLDTLLVGQALRANGPNKLTSWVVNRDGSLSEGPYSLVLEKRSLGLYLKSKNSPKPLLYYQYGEWPDPESTSLAKVVFNSVPESDKAYAFELRYDLYDRSNLSSPYRTSYLTRPKYNSTLSMFRLEGDGNIKIYTFYDKVEWDSWEVTYSLYGGDKARESACRSPTKCGSLGLCDNNQCVACPKPQGLVAWSEATCKTPKLPPCKNGSNYNKVDYYKVVGVEHFTNAVTEGDGPMKVGECRTKCDKDCGCLGFFYRQESSKCLLVPELGALIKVNDAAHVAYVKKAK